MLAQGQVFALDEAGIDALTCRKRLQTRLQALGITENDLGGDRNHLTAFAFFDHLGIQQVWVRPLARMGKASSLSFASGLIGLPIDMHQGMRIFRQLVTGKERNVTLSNGHHTLQEQIGTLLGARSDDESEYQTPQRSKRHPDPGVSVSR